MFKTIPNLYQKKFTSQANVENATINLESERYKLAIEILYDRWSILPVLAVTEYGPVVSI